MEYTKTVMVYKDLFPKINALLRCPHIGVWGGGGQGGQLPPQIRANSGWNSGKQWGKFGQSKKKKSARESYKLTPLECGWWRHTGNVQEGVLVNPFGMLMTSHRQCPSKGGGCLWMSKSRGVFQILGGWMTSRGQCPRGGVLVVICVKYRANQPLCPP